MAAPDETQDKSHQRSCELKEALKEGDWQKALSNAQELVAIAPASEEAQDAYLWLGLYHRSKRDFDTSTALYRKVIELYPGTKAAAEAYSGAGCNYYRSNKLPQAVEYFHKARVNAKTLHQRKYASVWAKWVRLVMAGQDQPLVVNCATKSVDYYLTSQGVAYDKVKLASSLTLKDGLVALPDVLAFLEKGHVKLNAVICPLADMKDIPLPFLAMVKPNHLIVIKAIESDGDKNIQRIRVYDPVQGEISYYEKELAEIWQEKVLTLTAPSRGTFAALGKKDLDDVYLGWCMGLPPPLNSCNPGDDCCNRESSSGSGSSGSGNDGGKGGLGGLVRSIGGGMGGCQGGCMSVGFPSWEVDTASRSLIVKDTPIGYKTALGEDMLVSMTYNSDQPHAGLFGNGWRSNLDMSIEERVGGEVIVDRSGGNDDVFTYSGGQYYPPIGVSDRLVKNYNGTFTLEYTRSHKKYHFDTSVNGGKLLAIEDRNGNTLTYQYNANRWLTSITDAVGRVTTVVTEPNGLGVRITQVTDPLGRVAEFTYDGENNLTHVVDMAGNEFTYAYDATDNYIISITEPKGTYTIEYEFSYYSSYDDVVKKIRNPQGKDYEYGGMGTTYVRDPRGNQTWYTFDYMYPSNYGDTTNVEDALQNQIVYGYDANRNRNSIRDRRGHTMQFGYDTNHNLLWKKDPYNHIWTHTYDASRNLISATDPRGKITHYGYDSHNNLVSVTEKDPNQLVPLTVTIYTPDSRGQITQVNHNGQITINTYDPCGNLIQVEDPEGEITTFTYDAIGRKESATRGTQTTAYVYDDLNRITRITHPDNTYIENTYSCCGLTQVRDENGKITRYEYDSLGRRTKVIDALNHETLYGYDDAGNLTSITDANNNTTTYTYDAVNRVTRTTYPGGVSESYTYDANGNILTKTDGNGVVIRYTYDKNNRLVEIQR